MTHLICDPAHNTPGMHDDTGAFEPGAEALARAFGHSAERLSIDNLKPSPERFADFLSEVGRVVTFDSWIFVSHGWHVGIEEGLSVGNLSRVAARIPPVVVALACSTASPPLATSFAAALVKYGARDVVAHDRLGHAYFNPFAVHVRQNGAVVEQRYVVEPHSVHWPAWVRALHTGVWIDMALFAVGATVPAVHGRGTFSRGADGFFVWTP